MHLGIRLEEHALGHRGRTGEGVHLVDADALTGQGTGDLADDSRAVVADEVDDDRGTGRTRSVASGGHGDVQVTQLLGGGGERVHLLVGDVDQRDAGEGPAESGHLALEPVPAVVGDHGAQGLDEAFTIIADEGQEQLCHGSTLASGMGFPPWFRRPILCRDQQQLPCLT